MLAETKRNLMGSAVVLLSAAGFATLPFFALSAYDRGITVSTLLFLRFAMAALLLGAAGARSGPIMPRDMPRGAVMILVALGLMFALDASLYLRAVKYVPAAMASLLLYAYPALVTVLSWAVDGNRPGLRAWIALILSTLGLVAFIGTAQVRANTVGICLGLSAALTYAAYIVLSARVPKGVSSTAATAWVCGVAALGILVMGLAMGDIGFGFEPYGWVPIIGMTLTSSLMGMFGFMKGVRMVGPARASVISTIEPVITALMAYLIYRQGMTAMQAAGGAAVLAGCIIVSLGDPPAASAPSRPQPDDKGAQQRSV